MAAGTTWIKKQENEKGVRTGNHVIVSTSATQGAAGGDPVTLAFGDAGSTVSRVQNVTSSIGTGAHEISELGDPDPKEIVDGLHRYSITVDALTFRNRSTVDVIQAGPVDISVADNFNGKDVKRFTGCRLVDERISVPKHGEVTRGVTFICLGEVP